MPEPGANRLPLASASVALACLLLATFPLSITPWLEYDRSAILGGQLWRLWTCHLVHYSTQHALADASALFLVGVFAETLFGTRNTAAVLLVGAPAISVGLLLTAPGMEHFRGASALPVLLGVASGMSLWRSAPKLRPLLSACCALLGVKILLEAIGISFTLTGLPSGVEVAWQAHLLAIASGAVWAKFGHPLLRHSQARSLVEMAPH